MSEILVLDPSTTRCGLALFREGTLVAAGCVKNTLGTKADILARVVHMAEACADWYNDFGADPTEIVVEWPPVYSPNQERKGGPKSVIALAGVCGALAMTIGCRCTSYLPADWTQQVPKNKAVKGAKKSPRAVKILSRLTQSERVVWDSIKYDDAIDAIGIGLWHLGRLDRRRVFPGSSEG